MHNLHFLLVQASSAREAAQTAECLVADWGDENNWRKVGGVASEDGGDDLENVDEARWGLSDLPEGPGTAFARALAWIAAAIDEPIKLDYPPFTECPTLKDAFHVLARTLMDFDPETGRTMDLWHTVQNLRQLQEIVLARRRDPGVIAEFFRGRFDQFGLTDLTDSSVGAKRYIVMLDMHS